MSQRLSDALDILAYGWGFVWALLYLMFTPAALETLVGRVAAVAWCAAVGVGAVIAIAGVLLPRVRLALEVPGIGLMIAGPLLYIVVQVFAMLYLQNTDRVAIAFGLALWVPMLMLPRLVPLAKRRRQASRTPLTPDELVAIEHRHDAR